MYEYSTIPNPKKSENDTMAGVVSRTYIARAIHDRTTIGMPYHMGVSGDLGSASGILTTDNPMPKGQLALKQIDEEELAGYKKVAIEAMEAAYAPYSEFKVGVAVITEDDTLHVGSNVESAIGRETVHAETAAVSQAVMSGSTKLRYVFVASKTGTTPCGACRQLLAEFGDPLVVTLLPTGEVMFSLFLSTLFPYPPKTKEK